MTQPAHPAHPDSFGARATLEGRTIFALDALQARFDVARLPYAIKVLLENVLRTEDGVSVTADQIEAVARWDASATPSREIAFTPSRVLLQDFTGVPCVVDLASMRDAMAEAGGDPARVEPLQPVDLVIDHSVQVDAFGSQSALARNAELEFDRNGERYAFLRWGQTAFSALKVVPPDTGICHQINLEYLARVVMDDGAAAFCDTLVGTDSHTTMINGLGVLGWGVGGIEAEAAMLGQPVSMLLPQVVGVRLTGALPEGATATDLVLTVTELLRHTGVVGRFVEFSGPGLAALPLADRATIGNMSPEFGSTCAIFPIDAETLRYLRFTGRDEAHVRFVEAYARRQGMFVDAGDEGGEAPTYSQVVDLDLASVEPSIAGPKRPQDRVALSDAKEAFAAALAGLGRDDPRQARPANGNDGYGLANAAQAADAATILARADESADVRDGSVVIAAITACTNTSNPSVMLAAGLVARNAAARGLTVRPWVKTSLAPGSKVVTEYLREAGLLADLETLGFDVVGYGCTTCIGNSGPLIDAVATAVADEDLVVAAVLSGNRNFEGRINQQVKANYLASPPLVVAYALAGRMDLDLTTEPLGTGADGEDVFLRDLWPTQHEVARTVESAVRREQFTSSYAEVYAGDERWNGLDVPTGSHYAWDPESTYVRRAPFFDLGPGATDVKGARVLALLGDSVTTDHISPAGQIKRDSPAGRWLAEQGVSVADFNSYGARRGNHEVMVRGTFANIRLRNALVPGTEGGVTVVFGDAGGPGEPTPIYDAAMAYARAGTPLVVLAGAEYGTGSSRDWAAKGTRLLGVAAVIAQSFERIHRSNLVGMGVLPLQFADGASAASLGLTGAETFAIHRDPDDPRTAHVATDTGAAFDCLVRIDTPKEEQYFAAGGILPYVLRELRAAAGR